ncbi:MAG: 16S rRNA (guanine(527)-N(7))-methyltransferase RsmG [Lachnospiraceae bacterium]|jgi:16S rRNA (guanine527-N7)-methyltransferase|nr:16S rRNA (guanine(527)-N(7))-methyltransferase RsmG [Lachnospiraceae bacterium]
MSQFPTEVFEKWLSQRRINFTDKQVSQIEIYYELLLDWNQRMNLTAITQSDEVIEKHFIDSLTFLQLPFADPTKPLTIIDVGTGAGFPGLVLKIMCPSWSVTLLDSVGKKVRFLDTVIKELKIDKIETIHGRAEDLAQMREYRETFDICVSRAVANLMTLSEYCLPFVKIGGNMISYKADKVHIELITAKRAITLMGGGNPQLCEVKLIQSQTTRNLIIIPKIKTCPIQFPRKAGTPQKLPIQ